MQLPAGVEERFRTESTMWMTTVRPSGQPQPSPIWFWWDGTEFLMFSKDHTARLNNIAANPKVSLNLDGDGRGGAIVIVEGVARIDRSLPPARSVPEYITKYQEFLDSYGWTAEGFSVDYPVPVKITPTGLRAW